MRIIECRFDLQQIVFLKTDKEQEERMITQITFNGFGIRYCLMCGPFDSWHYEYEITEEKRLVTE